MADITQSELKQLLIDELGITDGDQWLLKDLQEEYWKRGLLLRSGANGLSTAIAEAAPRGELGAALRTSNFTLTTTLTDVPGMSVTVEVRDRPIVVTLDALFYHNTAGQYVDIYIYEDTTQLQNAGWIVPLAGNYPAHREVRLTPTPGTHTYKVRAKNNGGTGNLLGATTYPLMIHVQEV